MIPVEEALDVVLEHASWLGAETVGLDDALARILNEDVASDVDMPPFDRSAMDGFALRADDCRVLPATLRVIGQVRAGEPPAVSVGTGEAVAIMTGAPLPRGADAVQQVEKTERRSDLVDVLAPVSAGMNVAPRGSEVRAGHRVLLRGTVIDPSVIAVLAAVGRSSLQVGRRPAVATLVTGDEIVDPSQTPSEAQIRNSNGPAIRAQALWAGAEHRSLGVVRDDAEAIARAVEKGLCADVLVVSGGVSEGAFDLVEGVFDRLGIDVLFRKVAIKPGAPLVFGRRGSTLVFGLPGNPVSAQVTFDVFVRPALLKMQGASCVSRPAITVQIDGNAKNMSGRRAHLPAHARFESDGSVARLVPSRGSADIVAHAQANCLVVIDADRHAVRSGDRAQALLLGNFLERDDDV